MAQGKKADETVVLSLNSGSSSLKLELYSFVGERGKLLASGAVEAIGSNDKGRIWLRGNGLTLVDENRSIATSAEAAQSLFAVLAHSGLPEPSAVGHRIVHGGPDLCSHQLISDDVLRRIQAASVFAPLHTSSALDVIRQSKSHFQVPQIACFDTAFHQSLPGYAAQFPLPQNFLHDGIRRYGFHGLSCESIISALGSQLADRSVIAHLGNGSSITAVRGGKSVETTMGLTPTGGVMMATRTGDLDPGLIVYLLENKGYEVDRLERLLNHESGMLGVSGKSGDVRTLIKASHQDRHASLALEMFCYSVRKAIGSMAAAIGGIELLVFTGGIGENAALVRRDVCRELGFLGFSLDPKLNEENASVVSTPESSCKVRVVPSEEGEQIAVHTVRIFRSNRTDCPSIQSG